MKVIDTAGIMAINGSNTNTNIGNDFWLVSAIILEFQVGVDAVASASAADSATD